MNQDVPCERPSTLPRKASERRFINGLYTGNSVENPEYLVPMRNISPISPAFDNPYYHDIAAKAQAVARASINGGTTHRQPNGYMTPTAENPEYLGLAETWSGQMEYTWGSIRYSLSASVSGEVVCVSERVSEWVKHVFCEGHSQSEWFLMLNYVAFCTGVGTWRWIHFQSLPKSQPSDKNMVRCFFFKTAWKMLTLDSVHYTKDFFGIFCFWSSH